ncbi:hypothetical protein [Flavobacterium columnare]|uniref:Uncharacterized protein n=1 Tax=Flavobacterium columnare TaxID=996 RepID=A0AAI8CGE1_9FLAO|nr:hypothetical protein [Flavobacterium columnare]AMO19404.1 hypothetical protein UN65_02725 [Flavobacterium columnare]AUX17340.1 hypothetical protein AQ623_02815 [Flavobacterium columnare]QOG56360.1 hypothetical protein HUE29_02755 [Flavobacterium columnare]QOG59084.1 hypothetical protein HUE30_02760 [Flavobacterium columnare]QOG61805.1 hypothetical protein HUE31_02760 [Flavobacterium columnare]
MMYFKAQELENKPFIQWESVAFSFKELKDLGLQGDPLIMSEDNIPNFMFGVCPLKIENGQLVERSSQELQVFEKEYNTPSLASIEKEVEELILKIETYNKLGEDILPLNTKLNELIVTYQFIKNKESITPLNF